MSEHNGISERLGMPDPTRAPEKCNVFEHARNGYAQLLPLFGHLGHGAIVPAVALLHGGVEWGRFFHRNTVDEVTVCFGSRDGVLNPGSVMVGGKMHGVDSFLRSTDDPQSFMLLVITQRQADEGEQHETITFRCSECNQKMFAFEFSGIDLPEVAQANSDDDEALEFFPTQWGTWAAAAAFNEDEAKRTCSNCGHVNAEFPVDSWAWQSYIERHAYVAESRRVLVKLSSRELTS